MEKIRGSFWLGVVMQYREFGKTGKMVSSVGMGTTRFKAEDLQNQEGLERCAQLIVDAANAGVNFFDSAATYAGGQCENILRLALPQIHSRYYLCGKSSSYYQRTKEDVLRYIETSLSNIGVEHFDFYYMWNVKSYGQYEYIMRKGGPYEGALAAKEQGLIHHICFSSHAPADDAIRIIRDGAFEGISVSYSLLNYHENDPVMECALQNRLGVSVMNPLAGGVIPQNQQLFQGYMLENDGNSIEAALRFVYSNPAVSTVMCGISKQEELEVDVKAIGTKDSLIEARKVKTKEVRGSFETFCTGCNYCAGCPVGIPISRLMTAYNQTKFYADSTFFNRTDEELIKRINFFKKLDGIITFQDAKNPCVKCGKCERICTQSLPIIETIDTIYKWVEENGVSLYSRKSRLQKLISPSYKRVGFYTAGFYTAFVMEYYRRLIGEFSFEVFVFDSDEKKWGEQYLDAICVRPPAEIPDLELDVLIVSNYIHGNVIYEDLKAKFLMENIQKLHLDSDVPWTF